MNIFQLIKKIFIPCQANNFFPLFLHKKFLNFYLILILILKIFTLPLVFTISKTSFFADIAKIALLELVNLERKAKNLLPLSENQTLNQSAYLKAKDILEKDYFAHWSPDGKSPWYWFKVSGYDFQFAGENLAIGFLDSKEVFDAWMNSPSHRQNILNPNYQEIGIAVLKGDFQGKEVYVVVQHFGKPKEKPTSPSPKASEIPAPSKTSGTLETSTPTQEIATPTEIASFETPTSTNEFQETEETKTLILIGPESTAPSSFSFKITEFLAKKYTPFLNGLIYAILGVLIFSLTLTILFDIFVYRKFIIDYKELIPRWIGFCLILIFFLFLDQPKLIKLIPHKFLIYGF